MKGPIIRVNADELHIHDPEFYSDIYAGNSHRVNKYPPTVAGFQLPTAGLTTVDHDLHRLRRSLISQFFSKRAITALDPLINNKIDKFCERIDSYEKTGQDVNFDAAFAALTAEVITQYFFGKEFDYINVENFNFANRDAAISIIHLYHLARLVPPLVSGLNLLPIPVVRKIMPSAAGVLQERINIKRDITAFLADDSEKKGGSVILEALEQPEVPASEKTISRLVNEGITVIGAGTETTARTLGVTLFHLWNDKEHIHVHKLRQELQGIEQPYSMRQLEKLPYLVSLIHHSIFTSHFNRRLNNTLQNRRVSFKKGYVSHVV